MKKGSVHSLIFFSTLHASLAFFQLFCLRILALQRHYNVVCGTIAEMRWLHVGPYRKGQ